MYDAYKGVIIFTRIKEGTIKVGTKMKMMATGESAEVVEVGTFGAGRFNPCDELTAGMVGYVTASLKNVQGTRVGDTITDADDPCAEPLPGYKKVNPMVILWTISNRWSKISGFKRCIRKITVK